MAKKIRFPLKMKNGAEVRTLDELKENFDLESVLGYFTDGKLTTWLADRYYDEKAEAVSALSADTPELNAKLCNILEVEYQGDDDVADLEYIQRRNEKIRILSAYTDNKDILNNIDIVAMSQDELYDILDESSEKVYLYGDKFEIPFGKKNINYIGVNTPVVIIEKNKYADDFDEAGISFNNVVFEEGAYQKKIVYPEPVGEFEIENGILKKGVPNSEGLCIIPYGVMEIGSSAFDNGSGHKLTSVTIPNTVNKIGWSAFRDCSNLTNVIIPDSVTDIEDWAFYDCRNLKCVTLPNSIKIIKNRTFYNCDLTNINIPDSVTSIENGAFNGCKLTTISIPNSISDIGNNAFAHCSNLTSVSIPNSVKRIGKEAFYFCSKLTSVSMNKAGISIDNTAFNWTPWGEQNGWFTPPKKKKSIWDLF